MSESLQGRVVLITGAAKRVGAAICRSLHGAGATVAVHFRRSAGPAQALVEALVAVRADSAAAFQADLLEQPGIERLVQECVGRFGRLDGLVNNASSFYATPLGSIREPHWSDLVGTNLAAPLFLSQEAAPHLRATRGAIVNITDIHAERPLPGYPLYCAAKAGLAGLTRALAVELGPEVRVNAIAPGPILWPDDHSFGPAARAAIVEHTLLRRCGTPEDVADTTLFLLRDARYMTGQIVAVDGGRSAHL